MKTDSIEYLISSEWARLMFQLWRGRGSEDPDSVERIKELLSIVQWNLARYDQIRTATASRASLLVSANALLLAGTTLLLNSFKVSNIHKDWMDKSIALAFVVFTIATIASVSISVWYCVGAVSAYNRRKTSRETFREELPSRFLFNWGDTLRSNGSFQEFFTTLQATVVEDMLRGASAELWGAIYQHSTKHRSLRIGIRFFKFSLLSFVVLVAMALLHKFY